MRKRTKVKLVAVAEDEAKGEFLAIIEFRDIDGKYRQLMLPRSDLDDIKNSEKDARQCRMLFVNKGGEDGDGIGAFGAVRPER